MARGGPGAGMACGAPGDDGGCNGFVVSLLRRYLPHAGGSCQGCGLRPERRDHAFPLRRPVLYRRRRPDRSVGARVADLPHAGHCRHAARGGPVPGRGGPGARRAASLGWGGPGGASGRSGHDAGPGVSAPGRRGWGRPARTRQDRGRGRRGLRGRGDGNLSSPGLHRPGGGMPPVRGSCPCLCWGCCSSAMACAPPRTGTGRAGSHPSDCEPRSIPVGRAPGPPACGRSAVASS